MYQKSDGRARQQKDKALEKALELATKYYEANIYLQNPEALDYIIKRKFNKQTLTDFRLGYAPHSGAALGDFLKRQAAIKLRHLSQ